MGLIKLPLIALRFSIGAFVLGTSLWSGAKSTYTAATNTTPLKINCADLTGKELDGYWFELKDCNVNLPHATYFSDGKTKKIESLYIPVFSDDGSKIYFALKSTRSEWIERFEKLKAITDEKETEKFVRQNMASYIFTSDLSGVKAVGLDSYESEVADFRKLNSEAAPEVSVVLDNKSPSIVDALAIMGIGAAIGLFMVGGAVRSFRR